MRLSRPSRSDSASKLRNRRLRKKTATPSVDSEMPTPSRFSRVHLKRTVKSVAAKLRRPAELLARALMIALVAFGAVALGRLVERHVRTSPTFEVESIAVTGNLRISETDLLEVSGLAIGRNVFDVTPEEARERLEEHPWIAEAEVERRLPDRYQVLVRERHETLLLALGDLFLVSDEGAVFKPVEDGDPVDLPILTGVERDRFTHDRAYRTSLLLEAVALLHDYRGLGLSESHPIHEIHSEPDRGISLYVGEESTYVRMGRGPFRSKLQRLHTVLRELGQRGARAAYVYLDNERRPDRVVVRLQDESTSTIDVSASVVTSANRG